MKGALWNGPDGAKYRAMIKLPRPMVAAMLEWMRQYNESEVAVFGWTNKSDHAKSPALDLQAAIDKPPRIRESRTPGSDDDSAESLPF